MLFFKKNTTSVYCFCGIYIFKSIALYKELVSSKSTYRFRKIIKCTAFFNLLLYPLLWVNCEYVYLLR